MVLLNFDNNQEEKYIMLKQMRSESPPISCLLETVLGIMTENDSNVDWSGATESIRVLLAGTNVYNLRPTLKMLTKTGISSSLADQILTGNILLLEERLKAKHETTRKETLAFIDQISGIKFANAADTSEWLSKFRR